MDNHITLNTLILFLYFQSITLPDKSYPRESIDIVGSIAKDSVQKGIVYREGSSYICILIHR